MGRIRGRDTSPEIAVRSALHRLGYRFRLHVKNLPGRPDIVLPKWKHIVLVHGCFWHRHKDCKFAYTPKSRTEFWTEKFEGNIARDKVTVQALKNLGWRVTVVWECEIRSTENLAQILDRNIRAETK